MQVLISVLLLIGFAVKMPIVPLHTWLPDAHVDAPTPVSMILAAILLKMGAFGIIRFNMQLLPEAFKLIVPVLAVFALVNIIYTALVAYSQSRFKENSRIFQYFKYGNCFIGALHTQFNGVFWRNIPNACSRGNFGGFIHARRRYLC